jgi:hypothetical protein
VVTAVSAAPPAASSFAATASLGHGGNYCGAQRRLLGVTPVGARPFVCVCSTHLFLLMLNIDDA